MNQTAMSRLFESFDELEKAIAQARQTLEAKEEPPRQILERINVYHEILGKQRRLAQALCGYASLGEWHEVSRHIQIINGLSAMIRDDARDVLSGLKEPSKDFETHLPMLC